MSCRKLTLAVVVVLKIVFVGANDDKLLVNTTVGMIRGLEADDGDYSMFLGIPYAVVNMTNPFGASIPNPIFDDVFNAYDDSAICPQVEEFNHTITGNLNCLHVNIYVPETASKENKLPVLVWIYGGSFSIGFAGRFLHGPKFFTRHDVIMVTLNYRLGPYGFMCLDTPEVPGNEGLKDQLKALRWIKNNIDAFNGDAEKITVFGESAGAVSVEFHLLFSDDGLFQKAITQSGTTLGRWAIRDSDPTVPIKIAAATGLETDDLGRALAYIRDLDTDEVIRASRNLAFNLRPCVEKEFPNVERFIPEHPLNVDIPKANFMPMIVGYNDHEMLAPHVNRPDEYFRNLDIFSPLLKRLFDFGEDDEEMALLVRRFYVGDEELSRELRWQVIDYDSDISYKHPVQRSVSKFLENGASVYHYVFSYSGGRNFVKQRMNVTEGGAAHADELGYLFDISYMTDPTPEDQLMIDRITTLWANFVKYGDPTPEASELLPLKWQPVTKERLNYIDLTLDMSVGARPFHRSMGFWDLFVQSNLEYLIGYSRN